MEFSYRISEAEYKQAFRLRLKAGGRAQTLKTVMFWVFVLVCLMLLWAVVERSSNQQSTTEEQTVTTHAEPPSANNILLNVGPFVLIAGAWVFILFRLGPLQLRRMYRRDPAMQGEFTVTITPESISTRNTCGTFSQTGWNIYEYWREGKGLIVLVMISRAYFALSLANLTDPQREELRGILAQVLPKK
jgi:hypothetical protein